MRKHVPDLPELVQLYKISEGRQFDSPMLKARMTIVNVDVPKNNLHVRITLKDGTGEWEENNWNLHHTIIGMQLGDYTKTGSPGTGRPD